MKFKNGDGITENSTGKRYKVLSSFSLVSINGPIIILAKEIGNENEPNAIVYLKENEVEFTHEIMGNLKDLGF